MESAGTAGAHPPADDSSLRPPVGREVFLCLGGPVRSLIISDVHGNLAALEAVLTEPHDVILCLGDLVGFGPDPAACLRRLRRAGGVARVGGNHDASWAWRTPSGAPPRLGAVADAVQTALRPELDVSDLAYLELLPARAEFTLDGLQTLLVHAAPSDPLQANVPAEPEAWARELATTPVADLLLVGHTHVQFQLEIGSTRVVNPGSVGFPNDGDPNAAYAVLENGAMTLKRVAYDVEATVRRIRERDLPASAAAPIEEWLRCGRMPAQLLGGEGAVPIAPAVQESRA